MTIMHTTQLKAFARKYWIWALVLLVTVSAWLTGEMSAAGEAGMLAADGGAAGAAGAAAAASGGSDDDEDRVVDLETARELIDDIPDDPTQEEIEEAKRELKEAYGDSNDDKTRINQPEGQGGEEERGDFYVTDSRPESYHRRFVRYLQGVIWEDSDERMLREKGEKRIQELKEETAAMGRERRRREYEEAEEILEDAPLTRQQRQRVMYSVARSERAREELSRSFRDGNSTLSTTEGEALVPAPVMAEVFRFVEEYGYARDFFRAIPMTSKSLDFTEVATKPVAYWKGELQSGSIEEIGFNDGGMTASKLFALSFFSNELDEDATVALMPMYTELFGESIALKEDKAAFRGDGGQDFGGFTGILNRGGVTVYTQGSGGDTSVEDFDTDDIGEVPYQISKARRSGAQWVLPESTVKALLNLKGADVGESGAGYILRDPESARAIEALAGYPLLDNEGIEDEILFGSDGASTKFGVFGDGSRALFGQRRGLSMETSQDAVLHDANDNVVVNSFQDDATAVRMTERVAVGFPQEDAFVVVETNS